MSFEWLWQQVGHIATADWIRVQLGSLLGTTHRATRPTSEPPLLTMTPGHYMDHDVFPPCRRFYVRVAAPRGQALDGLRLEISHVKPEDSDIAAALPMRLVLRLEGGATAVADVLRWDANDRQMVYLSGAGLLRPEQLKDCSFEPARDLGELPKSRRYVVTVGGVLGGAVVTQRFLFTRGLPPYTAYKWEAVS